MALSPHSLHLNFKRKTRAVVAELQEEQETLDSQTAAFQAMYCSGIPFESNFDQASEQDLCLLVQDIV